MPTANLLASRNARGKQESVLSHSELLRLLHYDPETGVWTWKVPARGRKVGDRADHPKTGTPYRRIWINVGNKRQAFYAHRLAWFYMTGTLATGIDHKDDHSNRWKNLRIANQKQNIANSKLSKNNKSGLKGVSKIRFSKKWASRITVDRKIIVLGDFESAYEAHLMYRRAARYYFGEFARAR